MRFALLALPLLLAGCSSPEPPEVVLLKPTKATVPIGTPGEDVRVKFGNPDREQSHDTGGKRIEGWQYGKLLIVLLDGKVTKVETGSLPDNPTLLRP